MSRAALAIVILILLFVVGVGIVYMRRSLPIVAPSPSRTLNSLPATMKISSSAFQDSQPIPAAYTCDGANSNPPLTFSSVPENARSLVLIVDDPDAPNGTWDHWVVFNIPPMTREIEEGQARQGVTGTGSSGATAYQGPCPPSGEHRYMFKLYALDTELDLAVGVNKKAVEEAMQGHILAQAQLIGLYIRKQ